MLGGIEYVSVGGSVLQTVFVRRDSPNFFEKTVEIVFVAEPQLGGNILQREIADLQNLFGFVCLFNHNIF